MAYVVKGDPKKAVQYASKGLELAPGDARVIRCRGFARMAAGDRKSAREDFAAALRLDAGDEEALFGVARCDDLDSRKEGAVSNYRRVLEINAIFDRMHGKIHPSVNARLRELERR